MRHRKALTLAVALSACVGCLDPLPAKLDAQPLDPRPIYRALWAEVETCSGLRGDFDRVLWFVIPGVTFDCPSSSGRCRGARTDPRNIYIASAYVDDSLTHYFTVRHEILHELGARPGHPRVFDTCHLRTPEQEQPRDSLARPTP